MRPGRPRSDAINAYRPGDFLDLLLASVLKDEVELVAHLVAHDPADADPAGLGQRLQPCGDIDPVAINVVLLDDDIAEIDADAEFDAPHLVNLDIAQRHLALQLDCTTHRIDDARDLGPQSITGRFDNAAAMLGDLGVRYFAAQRRQDRVRAFLVLAHQPRIARDIGRQDRRQPALDALDHRYILPAMVPFSLFGVRRPKAGKNNRLNRASLPCAGRRADGRGLPVETMARAYGRTCRMRLVRVRWPSLTIPSLPQCGQAGRARRRTSDRSSGDPSNAGSAFSPRR